MYSCGSPGRTASILSLVLRYVFQLHCFLKRKNCTFITYSPVSCPFYTCGVLCWWEVPAPAFVQLLERWQWPLYQAPNVYLAARDQNVVMNSKFSYCVGLLPDTISCRLCFLKKWVPSSECVITTTTTILTAVELSLGGISPYTSIDKTNKNKYP